MYLCLSFYYLSLCVCLLILTFYSRLTGVKPREGQLCGGGPQHELGAVLETGSGEPLQCGADAMLVVEDES